MGKRGPRQLPDGVKILAGNPGKQRLNKDKPQYKPIADTCPEYLGEVAKETWAKFAEPLEEQGLLTEVDGMQFRNLCVVEEIIQRAYERLALAEKLTTITQSGYEQQLPEVAILNNAIMQMHRLSDRFGLDPISRQSLISPKGKDAGSKLKNLLSK